MWDDKQNIKETDLKLDEVKTLAHFYIKAKFLFKDNKIITKFKKRSADGYVVRFGVMNNEYI